MNAILEKARNKIIGCWKNRCFWQLLIAVTVIFVAVWFYLDLVVRYADLAISWFFDDPEDTRNVIYFIAAFVGGCLLYWRAKTAARDSNTAIKNAITTERGLTAERLTRAIEQIAHEDSSVRLGGILGLEQIAKSAEEEREKIVRILVFFIRNRAVKNSKENKKDIAKISDSNSEPMVDFSMYRELRLDIETAIHVLASIASEIEREGHFREQYEKSKKYLCDLHNTDLRDLYLSKSDLSNFNLMGTDFTGAWLEGVNFTGANLFSIFLQKENKTKFVRTILDNANFNNTSLFCIDFSDSTLAGATFNNASLNDVIFDECRVNGVHFETSKGLTQEQINKTYYFDNDSPPFLPEGLKSPQSRPSPIKKSDDE